MSLYDYRAAHELTKADPPFYALIMAAMRKADTVNLAKLRAAFPDTYREVEARWHPAERCRVGDRMTPLVLHRLRWRVEIDADGRRVRDEDGDYIRHPEAGAEIIVNANHVVIAKGTGVGALLTMAPSACGVADWEIEVFESIDQIKAQLGISASVTA
ncbi:hypothetical protein C1Y40_04148 [Mycobacterium talmoniae]|uniref:Uncharacterized protein n=1 Tax=Mycobacterium talmoniae TaxID=1858794 RepID=A0A2S8BGA3_9MYCO|nr:hypothetical protein C1Y40_04148 [Mycobacterium talmoniae]